MDSMFIPATWEKSALLSNEALTELKDFKSLAIFSSVNFLNQLDEIKDQFSAKVTLEKSKRAKVCGQLLGCDSYCDDVKGSLQCEAILYIGDGSFHPDALLFSQIYNKQKVPVYRWNPKEQSLTSWTEDRIQDKVKKIKANLLRFTMSTTVGILVTTKHGQERLNDAIKLKEKLEKEEKEVFLFIDDTFNFQKAEDFNFIEAWVNTACPRIAQEDAPNITKPIINIKEAFDVNYYLGRI